MLVVLQNKQIADRWPLFREVLQSCIPPTKDMNPNWLSTCLWQALTGRIQLWLNYSGEKEDDDFYAAFVTKKMYDELTGQSALLVYAIKVFKMVSKEVRIGDMQTLAKIAKTEGFQRVTAFCSSQVVLNAMKKAFPNLEISYYVSVPIEGDDK